MKKEMLTFVIGIFLIYLSFMILIGLSWSVNVNHELERNDVVDISK